MTASIPPAGAGSSQQQNSTKPAASQSDSHKSSSSGGPAFEDGQSAISQQGNSKSGLVQEHEDGSASAHPPLMQRSLHQQAQPDPNGSGTRSLEA